MTRAEKMAEALKASGDFMFLKWDDGESELDEPQWRALLHKALAPMTCETCKYWRQSSHFKGRGKCESHNVGPSRFTPHDFGCLAHEPKEKR